MNAKLNLRLLATFVGFTLSAFAQIDGTEVRPGHAWAVFSKIAGKHSEREVRCLEILALPLHGVHTRLAEVLPTPATEQQSSFGRQCCVEAALRPVRVDELPLLQFHAVDEQVRLRNAGVHCRIAVIDRT